MPTCFEPLELSYDQSGALYSILAFGMTLKESFSGIRDAMFVVMCVNP